MADRFRAASTDEEKYAESWLKEAPVNVNIFWIFKRALQNRCSFFDGARFQRLPIVKFDSSKKNILLQS